jgi:hypothetical protein
MKESAGHTVEQLVGLKTVALNLQLGFAHSGKDLIATFALEPVRE